MNNRVFKIDKLPAIRRLPAYLHLFRGLSEQGAKFVSSSYFAEEMQIQSILVRKDLELTRISGTPCVGYSVAALIKGIEEFLGWNENLKALLVGAGQIGSFILGNQNLINVGLKIVAAFDNDPQKIGVSVHGVSVSDSARLEDILRRDQIGIAILCVPAEEAQQVADMLVAAGIKGIWNFTTTKLIIPEDIITQQKNLASGLAVLSAKLTKRTKCNPDSTIP
ncbi:MAG: redox-sensing transcriptional repressor Rex [Desulfuromonadales bacterium C00003096]|jgi:redox-sensing transcriptional repressor|nr:MAG: redox-sensing transcriptional repressor Rex [Desulfuromonadales bacterium C00003096]